MFIKMFDIIVFTELMGMVNDLIDYPLNNEENITLNLSRILDDPNDPNRMEMKTSLDIKYDMLINSEILSISQEKIIDKSVILELVFNFTQKKDKEDNLLYIQKKLDEFNISVKKHRIKDNNDTINSILDIHRINVILYKSKKNSLNSIIKSISNILIKLNRKDLYQPRLELYRDFKKFNKRYQKLMNSNNLKDYLSKARKLYDEDIFFEFENRLPERIVKTLNITNKNIEQIDPITLENLTISISNDDINSKDILSIIFPSTTNENDAVRKLIKVESLIDIINHAEITKPKIEIKDPTSRTFKFSTIQIVSIIHQYPEKRIYFDIDLHRYIFNTIMKKDILFFETLYNTKSDFTEYYYNVIDSIKKFIYDIWFDNDKSLEYIEYNSYEITNFIRKQLISILNKLIDDQIERQNSNKDILEDIFLFAVYKLALRNGAYTVIDKIQENFPSIVLNDD